MTVTVHHGDCLDILRTLPDNSIDAIVTDPPYGLAEHKPATIAAAMLAWCAGDRDHVPDGRGFMGRAWDGFVPPPAVWDECLRVLRPGGHLLAFAGSRTADLMGMSVRLAGFEMRDTITWLYGSGFPKSLDVSKAIDATILHGGANSRRIKAANAGREVVGERVTPDGKLSSARHGSRSGHRNNGVMGEIVGANESAAQITAPATDAARQWSGWGTALKPASEPVIVAVKPQVEDGTLVEIGSHLARLEAECTSRAKRTAATSSSAPTRHDGHEAKTGSAPASAATPPADEQAPTTRTGAADASSETTATSWSVSTSADTCLSTVTSWKACWTELSTPTSTSTTTTASGQTTDLQTLRSCLSKLTAANMLDSLSPTAGLSSLASAADSLFGAALLNSRATLALSMTGIATDSTPTSRPDGTAPGRRPASEPIVVARKPLQGTVAATVLAHGTGALNIDATRVGSDTSRGDRYRGKAPGGSHGDVSITGAREQTWDVPPGRWPSNVVLTHAPDCGPDEPPGPCVDGCPVAELDAQTADLKGAVTVRRNLRGQEQNAHGIYGSRTRDASEDVSYGDSGGASRFFPTFRYQAKAPTSERPKVDGVAHPTVKPLALMQWLVRLVTPPGGTVLDPFAGSGTTLQAARDEGFAAVGIEREAAYLPLIAHRLDQDIPLDLFASA